MMLACRPRPPRLAALSLFRAPSVRSGSTSSAATSTPQPADKPQDSIFTAPESPWDHVFSDIDPVPPPLPRLRSRLGESTPASLSRRKNGHGQAQDQGLLQRSSGVRHQRASITAREMSVFDEMFDMIFNAVSAQDGKASSASASARTPSRPPPTPSSTAPSSSLAGQTPSIGRAGAPLDDLFRTLRRRASRTRWTSAIDEELDRKKETMELLNTDYDLLQWVTTELFGDAQRWDDDAKQAAMATSTGARPVRGTTTDAPKGGPSAPSVYPHLIAHAMRIFRTTYANPSLALAVFEHAARASISSYVFGCTAPAYNELIEAKWEGWGDLEGVCSALEEMQANGVKIDGRTRIVVERVRREVGEARPVELGEDGRNDVHPLARRVWEELGEAEVMRLLQRIERLALRDRSRKPKSSPLEESWKSAVLQSTEDDGWSFDGWDEKKDAKPKAKPTPRTLDDWTLLDTPEEETTLR